MLKTSMVLRVSKPSKRIAHGVRFQAVLGEQSKVVCVRFGHDFSPECMKMDEVRKRKVEVMVVLSYPYHCDFFQGELASSFREGIIHPRNQT